MFIGTATGRIPGLGSAATPAWEQLRQLAEESGATALYDPDNPNTWTLRADGGNLIYEATADALGNRETLVQTTASIQPLQRTLSTGRRVWDAPSGGKFMLADFASNITQPNTFMAVLRTPNTDQTSAGIVDSDAATGGRQQLAINGLSQYRMFAGSIMDRSTLTEPWRIAQCNFNGDSSELFLDGVKQGSTGNTGTQDLGGIGILGVGPTSNNFVGSLGPVIVFSGLKANAELADLRAKINDLYPIGVSE